MKIASKLMFTTCLMTAMTMSSFAFFEVGVDGKRTWANRAAGIAYCDNIEGVIGNAGIICEVKKSDVRKLTIKDFAMDYLYKRNLRFESNNRDIFASGTFASALSSYSNLTELVIENLVDSYPEDNRRTAGVTTKAAYEGNFWALFQNAKKNLVVTIKNINLSKTNLKNAKGNFVSVNNTTTRIMPSGLVSVNISDGKSWVEDIEGNANFNFSGSSATLRSFSADNLRLTEVPSLMDTFNGCTNLSNFSVTKLSAPNAASLEHMFNGCTELASCTINNLKTPNASNFGHMFDGCTKLTSCSINNLSAASATNFSYMFDGCTELTSCTINNLNAPNVTNLDRICNGCIELTDFSINTWNIQDTTNIDNMFYGCLKLSNFAAPNTNIQEQL